MATTTAHTDDFDALAYVKELTQVGVPKRQAEVMAKARAADRSANAATRADAKEGDRIVSSDIEKVRVKLEAKIDTTKAELEVRLIKWMIGTVGSGAALVIATIIAALKFLL